MKIKKNESSWIASFCFALSVVIFIRWFAFEHFSVVSSSMEGTILTGDHIIVNKLCYGARTPITPIQVPITHRSIFGIRSFSNIVQFKSFRLPGFSSVRVGDIIVFNYPAEINYPIDMRDYYIKRCVGLAGDFVCIKNSDIFINEKRFKNVETTQFRFFFKSGNRLNNKFFISHNINEFFKIDNGYEVFTNFDNARKILQENIFSNVIFLPMPEKYVEDKLFMNRLGIYQFDYNADWFGPIQVPFKGMIIPINSQNLALYGYSILNHEHINATIVNQELFINKVKVNKYVFKQDYYFALGDNRHNSLDSRYWGFVPYDHLVGKALCVLFSSDYHASNFWEKFRFRRCLKTLS